MTEQTSGKVPQIRFKSFEEEWNTCRLDEAATVERGKFSARPRNDPKYFGGNIPFVQTGDVVSANRRLRRFSQTLNEEGLAVSRSFPKDTILITIAANIGDLAISDFDVACPDSVVAINVRDEFDTNFLHDFLGTKKDYLEAAATTAAQANINLKILKPLIVVLPTLNEQTQIGEYFRALDSLIGLHQRKHDKLVTLKKAMLQKMFPQPGATVPGIRFKGFEGNWVAKKLGEVGAFNPKEELPEVFEYVDLESVTGTEMINHRSEKKKTAPSRAQRLAQRGDLFFQTVRPYQKNNYLFTLPFTNYVFSTGYAQIRPFNDGSFLLGMMQREEFVKLVLDNCTGTSYPAINANVLAEIFIMVPTPEEQQKIGTYFRTLDALIAQHATQLQKLQQLKSACLEKMFV